MKNDRFVKIISVIAVVIVLILLSSAFGLITIPKRIQSTFYSALYTVTQPQSNPESLESLHEATKAKKRGPKGEEYTYKYTEKDRGLITSDSARCEACHGSMLDEEDGNAKFPIHKKMLEASMLNFSCTDCHKKVDLSKRSPNRVTIRVDRTLCPVCHEPAGASATAEASGGESWGSGGTMQLPALMSRHGKDKKSGKEWILKHPRVAVAVGLDQCRKCHLDNSELDFCRECHLRGGFRPSSHRAIYKTTINEIYPDKGRKDKVDASWKGYHFVFAREALAKLGAKVTSPKNLPLDKVQKLTCGACHQVKDWCTRCHIKHAPNWLDPNKGHAYYVFKYGKKYCSRCHDSRGTKCVSCHSYVGRLQ